MLKFGDGKSFWDSSAAIVRWYHSPYPWAQGRQAHGSPWGEFWGGLTSSLTSRRMEGWSGMALKRVPTTQHFSPGCSSHSCLIWTPLPGAQEAGAQNQVALGQPHSIAAQASPGVRKHPAQGPLSQQGP